MDKVQENNFTDYNTPLPETFKLHNQLCWSDMGKSIKCWWKKEAVGLQRTNILVQASKICYCQLFLPFMVYMNHLVLYWRYSERKKSSNLLTPQLQHQYWWQKKCGAVTRFNCTDMYSTVFYNLYMLSAYL
jgi:hypothetical protein